MSAEDERIARVLLALSIASFLASAAYAIQHVVIDLPSAPWLGQAATALLVAHFVYTSLAKRKTKP